MPRTCCRSRRTCCVTRRPWCRTSCTCSGGRRCPRARCTAPSKCPRVRWACTSSPTVDPNPSACACPPPASTMGRPSPLCSRARCSPTVWASSAVSTSYWETATDDRSHLPRRQGCPLGSRGGRDGALHHLLRAQVRRFLPEQGGAHLRRPLGCTAVIRRYGQAHEQGGPDPRLGGQARFPYRSLHPVRTGVRHDGVDPVRSYTSPSPRDGLLSR